MNRSLLNEYIEVYCKNIKINSQGTSGKLVWASKQLKNTITHYHTDLGYIRINRQKWQPPAMSALEHTK